MAEVKSLLVTVSAGLQALQSLQEFYDEDMWDIDDPLFSKLRHIHIHLSSVVGKLARALEPSDHLVHNGEAVDVAGLATELAPLLADMLMHCAQLANATGADLPSCLQARYRQNAERFAPESAFMQIGRP